MKTIHVRNVHEALPVALQVLDGSGIERQTRVGPVLQTPWPVTTIYERPLERVVFWPARDCNPFFHLYESLWMLNGRNDVKPLLRYVKTFDQFSDNGTTLHGAYGFRWRQHFGLMNQRFDQLELIAKMLRENPDDRRAVLQIWSASDDLARIGKDVPCNTMATFQRDVEGRLNLVVFCRSNDIIWGAYGANAVHFAFLLEYMALWIGCAPGTYTQISVNWHAYLNKLEQVDKVRPDRVGFIENPYMDKRVQYTPMAGDGDVHRIDELIGALLDDADDGFSAPDPPEEVWASTVYHTLKAHHHWKQQDPQRAFNTLLEAPLQNNDWVVAAHEWFLRRRGNQLQA